MSRRPKSGSSKSTPPKSRPLKTLPASKAASTQVTGGKRTVVKDSSDKFANTQTNY